MPDAHGLCKRNVRLDHHITNCLISLWLHCGFFHQKKNKLKRGCPPRVRKKCPYYLVIGQTIIILLGYAVFFYWTCYVLLPQLKDSQKCFSGYNLLDFLNWLSLLLTTMLSAMLVLLTCVVLIVCGPCIYSIVREALLQ